jgi:hypothetical protein
MALYAFDGTWNDSRSPDRNTALDTNVHRFLVAYDDEHDKKTTWTEWEAAGGSLGS